MWGDPRPANRMGPFRGSQEERFAPGWNREYPPSLDNLAQERHSGNFSGRESLPFDISGLLNPQFANREEASFAYGARDAPRSDFRGGEGHHDFRGRDFPPSDFQNRDDSQLDFRGREPPSSEFRGREMYSGDFQDREGPSMDFRGGDAPSMDYRTREANRISYRDREAHTMDYRGREDPPPDFRNRGSFDLDFRGREGAHSDFRPRDVPESHYRGREHSYSDFRNRDVPDLDFRGMNPSDLDFRNRQTPPSDFRNRHKPRSDQDFRGRDMAASVDFTDREMPPVDQNLVDFRRTQATAPSADSERPALSTTREESALDRSPFGIQKGEFQHSEPRAREGESLGAGLEMKSSLDFQNSRGPLQDRDEPPQSFANQQQLSGTEHQRSDSSLMLKGEGGLDFLGRQDTDYRSIEYRDVDHRLPGGRLFDYEHGKSFTEGKPSREPRQDLQDQDYRTCPKDVKPSKLIRLGGVPETATKDDILNAFRGPDGTPVKDLRLKDYSSDAGRRARRPVVWICGHSIVDWAHRRASSLSGGPQLGLSAEAVLSWHGRRGMLWDQLMPLLHALGAHGQAPDIIVVHLGENDLGMCKGVDLMIRAKRDLGQILELFPGVQIVWSDMLQRRVWDGALKPPRVDKARRYVNREVAKFLAALGGSVISHPAIAYGAPELFSEDGVHLSDLGADVFLADIREGIRRCLGAQLAIGGRHAR